MGLTSFPNAPESEKAELTWGSKHEDHEALNPARDCHNRCVYCVSMYFNLDMFHFTRCMKARSKGT